MSRFIIYKRIKLQKKSKMRRLCGLRANTEHIASVNRSVRAHLISQTNYKTKAGNLTIHTLDTEKHTKCASCDSARIYRFHSTISRIRNFGSNNLNLGGKAQNKGRVTQTQMRKIINDNGQWYDEKCVSRKAKGHRGDYFKKRPQTKAGSLSIAVSAAP